MFCEKSCSSPYSVNNDTTAFPPKTAIVLWYTANVALCILILSHRLLKRRIQCLDLMKLVIFTALSRPALSETGSFFDWVHGGEEYSGS